MVNSTHPRVSSLPSLFFLQPTSHHCILPATQGENSESSLVLFFLSQLTPGPSVILLVSPLRYIQNPSASLHLALKAILTPCLGHCKWCPAGLPVSLLPHPRHLLQAVRSILCKQVGSFHFSAQNYQIVPHSSQSDIPSVFHGLQSSPWSGLWYLCNFTSNPDHSAHFLLLYQTARHPPIKEHAPAPGPLHSRFSLPGTLIFGYLHG